MARAVKEYIKKLSESKSKLHRTPKESREAMEEDRLIRRYASGRYPEEKVRKQAKKTRKAVRKIK